MAKDDASVILVAITFAPLGVVCCLGILPVICTGMVTETLTRSSQHYSDGIYEGAI
jgi:hypothetical protein